jgi:hypothetical protein
MPAMVIGSESLRIAHAPHLTISLSADARFGALSGVRVHGDPVTATATPPGGSGLREIGGVVRAIVQPTRPHYPEQHRTDFEERRRFTIPFGAQRVRRSPQRAVGRGHRCELLSWPLALGIGARAYPIFL